MNNFPANSTQRGRQNNERSVAVRGNNQNRFQPNQPNPQERIPGVPGGYHVVKFPPPQRNDVNNYSENAPAAGDAFGPFGTNANVDTDALAVGSMLAYRNPYVGIAPVVPLTPGAITSYQPEVFGLEPIEGVLPGFEALHGHGIFYIREHVDSFEFFTGYEMSNRYSIYSPLGRIYLAGEKSTFCQRYCYAEARAFMLNIFDPSGRLLFYLERPCSPSIYCCGSGCNGSDVAVILAEGGEILGAVNQNCSCSAPQFTITDSSGQALMTIEGPSGGACCPCALFGDISFQIFDMNHAPVGTIMKRFTIKEVSSDANDFGLLIPAEFDARLKAVLLGAVFSIDFSFFESSAGSGRGRNAFRGCEYCPCCRGTWLQLFWTLFLCFIFMGIPMIILFKVYL